MEIKYLKSAARLLNRDYVKDLSRVKSGFKSVAPQFHFEITRLASAVKWREIQIIDEEERF